MPKVPIKRFASPCTLYEESEGSEEGGAKPSKTDVAAATSYNDIELVCDKIKIP